MPEKDTVIPVRKAGFVDPSNRRDRRKRKLEEEEREIEELLKQHTGEDKDGEQNEEDKGQEGEVSPEQQDEKDGEAGKDEPTGSAEERTFKKRYGDLRRHSQKVEDTLKQEIKELKEQLQKGPSSTPVNEEDFNEWVEKNPRVAAIVEKIAAQKAEEKFAKAEKRLQTLDEEQGEFMREKQEALIRKSHPDFERLRDDDSFHDWADEQPKWVKDALYENADDAQSVIRVIDLYKMDKGITKEKKKANAAAAAKEVKTTKAGDKEATDEKPKFSESQINRNSEKWFEKNWEAINEAMREGRFEYDLTGGAR